MDTVTIKKIPTLKDKKGITLEWCKNEEGKQVSIYYRKRGTHFAQHYHSGSDPSKNPEKFLLLTGKIKLIYIDSKSSQKIERIISPCTEIRIPPFTKHNVIAIEDCIFIEYRSTVFDKHNPDTIHVDETEFI